MSLIKQFTANIPEYPGVDFVLTRRSDDWHCQLSVGRWGCGKTIEAAIADVIASHLKTDGANEA